MLKSPPVSENEVAVPIEVDVERKLLKIFPAVLLVNKLIGESDDEEEVVAAAEAGVGAQIVPSHPYWQF